MSYNLTNAVQGGNLCLSKAALSGLSGAATTISTTGTTAYTVNGAHKTKAAITGGATPTVDVNTGAAFKPQVASTVACYVFGFDAAGNTKVAQGKVVPWVDVSANSTSVPLPTVPDSVTPIAYAVIKAGATTAGNWVFGTSLWNATGIVIDTPVDVMLLPPVDPITA